MPSSREEREREAVAVLLTTAGWDRTWVEWWVDNPDVPFVSGPFLRAANTAVEAYRLGKDLHQVQCCTCDDFCDEPCNVHARENTLQDMVAVLKEDNKALKEHVKKLEVSARSAMQKADDHRRLRDLERTEKNKLAEQVRHLAHRLTCMAKTACD